MLAVWVLMREQPGWGWLAVAALFLAAELATGSGYLLWPSAAAGITGVLKLVGAPLTIEMQVALFAVLTFAGIYGARRLWPARGHAEPAHNLNDQKQRLIGREGEAVATGDGRVFVDGKEWAAELEGGGQPAPGARVRVTAVLGGARLQVIAL
ncbi:NfeD family protein [soil metagenome]